MLATVISYCTNDERFIRECIEQASKVSDVVIVPISSHLFDGTPENTESITKLSAEYPNVSFIMFDWEEGKHPRYWHNMSRIVGNHILPEDVDWVLFLDSDEILDSKLFNEFKKDPTFNKYDSYKLGCYWYFRDNNIQATTYEDSPVLVRKHLVAIDPDNLHSEREQLHEALNVPKRRMVLQNNTPMVHHYSWVRTREQMIQKVKAWGHNTDKDWVTLIEEEFSRPFNGTCFVNNYEFNIVELEKMQQETSNRVRQGVSNKPIGISLGWNCGPAGYGVENGLRETKANGYRTCPFDEMVSNLPGVVECIRDDFKYLLDDEFLEIKPTPFAIGGTPKGENLIYNTKYNFFFNHESPGHANLYIEQKWAGGINHYIDNNFLLFKERYNRRVKAFRDYIQQGLEGTKIRFIIFRYNHDVQILDSVLKEKYPTLDYELVVVSPFAPLETTDFVYKQCILMGMKPEDAQLEIKNEL